MSLTTPTTKEISDNITAQLEASLNQTIPLFPKAFNRVLPKALAAVFILLYKYAGFIFLQMFVSKASFQDTTILGVIVNPLKFWGRLIGVGDPAAATQAELQIDITVETQVGTLPAGTQLVSSDNGVTYLTITSVLLNAATVSVNVRASSDQTGRGGVGEIGNLDPGAIISFANPLANVARDAVVTAQVVTGADGEKEAAYRQRVIDRFQKQPQGGAYADYELWAEEPAGILNAYPYTSDCPGQVDVYIESATEPDGIPTNAQLTEALESIELDENGLASRRPANALANTLPITRVVFDVQVTGIIVDNLAQVQQDIETAIAAYFLEREPFIPGLSILPRRDRITRSGVAGVVDDIINAAGGIFGGVSITTSSIDFELYNLGIGEKSKMGVITFV